MPSTRVSGAQIRLLMITAWMGQGDETSAIATRRLLSRCQQPEIVRRPNSY